MTMTSELTTAREVIAALGGAKAVAELTGHSTKTVSAWQSRFKRLPPRTHHILKAALLRGGYTAPLSLWQMIEGPPTEA